jgi:type I restriction enzyme S subunit
MHKWQQKSLGEFIELKRGYDLPSRDRVPGEFPLVSSSGPTEFISQSKAKGPGVVTGRYGTVGQVFYVQKDFWPLNTALYVKDFRGNNPRFVYYFLQGIDWEKFNDKSGVPGINRNDVHREPVFVPPLDQQEQVASVLGALDDKIELNRRMNETLKAMAQAIFRDWFVDFGPVRRKLEGATDPVAIMGGLMPDPARAAELAGLFPDGFGEDALPTGWRSDPLKKHIANFDSKRVPVSSGERAKRPGTFPYYGAASAMGTIDNFLFDGVFVLVGEDGSVVRSGGLAVTQYVWGQFWVNNHAHVLQGAGAVSTEQLLLYFNEEPVAPYVTGAVQMKLSQGRMGMMPFIFPGDPICGEFGRVVGPLFERLRAAAAENHALAETRDYLLPRLMSGEVRVGDVQSETAA